MTKPDEAALLVASAELDKITLVVAIEVISIMIHDKMSPTNYLQLTPEQRNNSRRRANTVINDALHFWESEARKRNAPQ